LHSPAAVEAHVCEHGGRPRELVSWLRRKKVGKTVMEASGGYEREWAKALRGAKIEVRIVDPKRVRDFARRPDGWPRTIRSMLR
jgi:transposase